MLIRSLLKNGDDLNQRKIIVPRPRRYRTLLGEVTQKYRGDPMPDDVQQDLFDRLMMGYAAERVIFGFENFLCPPQKIFEYQKLYGKTYFRSTWLRYLFPENPCEFFLAIRNPATFVPAAMRAADTTDYAGYTKGVDPRQMRWSEVISALMENNPDCPITVWCNEDTPLIWPTVLREISDADDDIQLSGEFDVLRSIMTEDGFARMESYLANHVPPNEIQRRRVFAAFLDKFAISGELEEDIDLPGWTPEFVNEVTALYDDDVYKIERMPGVNFITT
ncbi:hypothetical protein AIOL_002503 [Candidatus Rhodobacter oscarellae]|uniref:Sulfotransferase family protein n=1 Tax=Candidatus Rhodobacter oscarellae TaxID=1675527 RepID=A0A0J9GVD9_9RHOB|nr:hypothetical protein [Candidatus Rhodobacter lobularis]KMW57538.1 hypothetical protein AIOL_002503 [Candidatus Rhodobacter lobularis]